MHPIPASEGSKGYCSRRLWVSEIRHDNEGRLLHRNQWEKSNREFLHGVEGCMHPIPASEGSKGYCSRRLWGSEITHDNEGTASLTQKSCSPQLILCQKDRDITGVQAKKLCCELSESLKECQWKNG